MCNEEALSLISAVNESEKLEHVRNEIEDFLRKNNAHNSILFCIKLKSSVFRKILPPWIQNTYDDWKFFTSMCEIGSCKDSFFGLIAVLNNPQGIDSFTLDYCVKLLSYLVKRRMTEILSELNSQYCMNHVDSSIFQTVMSIVNVPCVVANIQKLNLIKVFVPKNYFAIVGNALVCIVRSIIDDIKKGNNVTIKFLVSLCSKCFALGHAEAVDVLLDYFISSYHEAVLWRIARRFLCETGCIDSIFPNFLRRIKSADLLNVMLSDEITVNAELRTYLTHTLFFCRTFSKHAKTILHNVINYLCSTEVRRNYYQELFVRLCKVWGLKNTITNVSDEQRLYLSQAIIVCLQYYDKQLDEKITHKLLIELTEGVRNYIGSDVKEICKIGMVIGEVMSRRLSHECDNQLEFKYEEDEITLKLKNFMDFCFIDVETSNDAPKNDANLAESFDDDEANKDKARHSGNEDTTKQLRNSDELDWNDVNNGGSAHKITVDFSKSDSDSDDFVPYDLSADIPQKSMKSPVYLKECLEGLSQTEDVERNEECLSAVKGLMETHLHETYKLLSELSRTLINLFPTEEMYEHKIDALVFLTVKFPVYMAAELTNVFYDRNFTLTTRMEVLDIIRKATQQLSSSSETNNGDATSEKNDSQKVMPLTDICVNSSSVIPLVFSKTNDPVVWKDVVEKRIALKTRRFHSSTTKNFVETQNLFGKYVELFFYPLITQYNKPREYLNLLQETSLLGSLVLTLAFMCVHSQYTPAYLDITKELLEMIDSLTVRNEPFIKRCCLSSLLSLTVSLISSASSDNDVFCLLLKQVHWAVEVINDDTDVVCTQLANEFLMAAQKLFKQEAPEIFELLCAFRNDL